MASLVVGVQPSMYLPGRGMWVSYGERLRVLPLSDLLEGTDGFRRLVHWMLEKALSKATELGVSVRPETVRIEEDPEVRGWRYAVISLRVPVPEGVYPAVAEALLKEAYRGLSVEDALRVHVEVDRV